MGVPRTPRSPLARSPRSAPTTPPPTHEMMAQETIRNSEIPYLWTTKLFLAYSARGAMCTAFPLIWLPWAAESGFTLPDIFVMIIGCLVGDFFGRLFWGPFTDRYGGWWVVVGTNLVTAFLLGMQVFLVHQKLLIIAVFTLMTFVTSGLGKGVIALLASHIPHNRFASVNSMMKNFFGAIAMQLAVSAMFYMGAGWVSILVFACCIGVVGTLPFALSSEEPKSFSQVWRSGVERTHEMGPAGFGKKELDSSSNWGLVKLVAGCLLFWQLNGIIALYSPLREVCGESLLYLVLFFICQSQVCTQPVGHTTQGFAAQVMALFTFFGVAGVFGSGILIDAYPRWSRMILTGFTILSAACLGTLNYFPNASLQVSISAVCGFSLGMNAVLSLLCGIYTIELGGQQLCGTVAGLTKGLMALCGVGVYVVLIYQVGSTGAQESGGQVRQDSLKMQADLLDFKGVIAGAFWMYCLGVPLAFSIAPLREGIESAFSTPRMKVALEQLDSARSAGRAADDDPEVGKALLAPEEKEGVSSQTGITSSGEDASSGRP